MRLLWWLAGVPVAVIVVVFAISNRHEATLGLWPFSDGLVLPMYLAVLAPLVAGLLIGLALGGTGALWARMTARRQSRRADSLARQIDTLKAETAPPPLAPPRDGVPPASA